MRYSAKWFHCGARPTVKTKAAVIHEGAWRADPHAGRAVDKAAAAVSRKM